MQPSDASKPEQLTQVWFWGDHGIGGGDLRMREPSRTTLHFLIDEIERRGIPLEFDKSKLPPRGDPLVPVLPKKGFSIGDFLASMLGNHVREVPSVAHMHPTAIQRYQQVQGYRPEALKHLEHEILAYDLNKS